MDLVKAALVDQYLAYNVQVKAALVNQYWAYNVPSQVCVSGPVLCL